MDPYQAYRRGLISYATYVAKMEINNIDVTDTVDEPIDPGDYSAIIANATVIAGADTMATDQSRTERQEVPLATGRLQYRLGVDAHFVEDDRKFVDERDV